MSCVKKRWLIAETDRSEPVVARLRRLRGLDDGAPETLHDPFLMRGMDRAVQRLRSALECRERITVFGDYDADGVTGTALMIDWLRSRRARASYLLPHRIRDGYGLQAAHVERVIQKGTDLLVTVDNGISAQEALGAAARAGLDVIVVDHHHQTGELPPAVAVLNPKRHDCEYPFKELAAVGVAYKLLQALDGKPGEDALDLVALGTVADLVPLRGENRVLVRGGLVRLNNGARPGIMALKEVCRGQRGPVSSRTIGWQFGPRINCAGRLAEADLALELLLASELGRAREIAGRLDQLNSMRQEIQRNAIRQTEHALKEAAELHRIIIVIGEDWHLGVVGLIAGKIAGDYNRPAMALTRVLGDGLLKGSARSVPGFNITSAIAEFQHLLVEFGGHSEAAGLSIREEHLQDFVNGITALANRRIEEDPVVELRIDTEVDAGEIDFELLHGLEELAPFGSGNPRPVFILRDCRLVRKFSMSQGRHLKLWIENGNVPLEAVWWDGGGEGRGLQYGDRLDLAFELQLNHWNGKDMIQLVLQDLRPTGTPGSEPAS